MSELTRISKPSDSPSLTSRIKIQLTQAAMMRGAKLDEITIRLYSARLAQEPFDDVITALGKIADMPREQYETALPDMGTVLEMVQVAGLARRNRESAAHDLEHVAWECRTCHGTCGDFYPISRNVASEPRYCQRPSQRPGAKRGEICGGNLAVAHSERAERASEAVA